jgi:hypothetical protein
LVCCQVPSGKPPRELAGYPHRKQPRNTVKENVSD